MKWTKKGLIYNFKRTNNSPYEFARVPIPQILKDRIRFYLTVQDEDGIGYPTFIDTTKDGSFKVININDKPLFMPGVPGTFDENGCMAISIVNLPDNTDYMYYVGFELGTKIRYRLLSGLAIYKKDEGFTRISQVPILERSNDELFFRGGPFVLYENNIFRMWYAAGKKWIEIDGKSLPTYTINYLESNDGINWGQKGKVCIDIENDEEHGFGRPYVIKHDGMYKMFYSKRIKHLGYRMGYAESNDGINWQRKDDEVNLDVSETGWDSEVVAYPAVIELNNIFYMFYNGNGMGKTGFGYAKLESW